MTSLRIATRHSPTPFSPLTRYLLPSARPLPRRALTTSSPASSSPNPVPISTYHYELIKATPTCPPSACACADTPSGLEIDHERPLGGTMPPYVQHVVVRTGRKDWGSKIEEEDASVEGKRVNFARILKGLVGSGGEFHNPEQPILITNSSLRASPNPNLTSVDVFPQCVHVPRIPNTPEGYGAFVRSFLLSKSERSRQGHRDIQESKVGSDAIGVSNLEDDHSAPTVKLATVAHRCPTILICGHNSRDTRCGILGPLLRAGFNSYIRGGTRLPAGGDRPTGFLFNGLELVNPFRASRVALTSHIGGHAFAGNVIIYLPKKFQTIDGKDNPLAGKGIWYGRVEPRHVWGIMESTQRGIVIEELLRGIYEPIVFGGRIHLPGSIGGQS